MPHFTCQGYYSPLMTLFPYCDNAVTTLSQWPILLENLILKPWQGSNRRYILTHIDILVLSRKSERIALSQKSKALSPPPGELSWYKSATSTRKFRRPRTLRKTRRDAGSTRPTTRDKDVVRLGAEQTFVRYDTVGEWLAPDHSSATEKPSQAQLQNTSAPTKRPWPQDRRHRLMATIRLLNKLERQGYVEIIQPWADQPAWYRATTQGLRSIGLDWDEIPFPESYEDLEARLRHDQYFKSHNHLINQVRMLLARGGAGVPDHTGKGSGPSKSRCQIGKKANAVPIKPMAAWTLKEDGQWEMKGCNWQRGRYRPMKANQVIAIEVECSLKSDGRLLEILPDLMAHHDFVWYFCLNTTIRQAVSDARKLADLTE